jgi:glutathione synthase/RimK-type ligase-like ATP-grasp enzyme
MKIADAPLAALSQTERTVVSVLTATPLSPSLLALVDACAEEGIVLHCGRAIERDAVLVLQWGHDNAGTRSAVRRFCAHRGIEFLNSRIFSKWQELVRFAEAGLPTPRSIRIRSLDQALDAADAIGYPVVVKPLYGLKSRGVELFRDSQELARRWLPSHGIVQQYLVEGNHCTRMLVVGETVVHAVTRVALDGFHATYDHGRRASLEAFPLASERAALAVAACRALDLAIGGVDLVETSRGPMLLEANHVRVDFSDVALHGNCAVTEVARFLAGKARGRVPTHPVFRKENASGRVALVTGLPRDPGVEMIRDACAREGLQVDVTRTTDPTAEGLWFWGLSARHYRRAAPKASAVSLPAVNGRVQSVSVQRGRLFRAGYRIPRSRLAYSVVEALQVAREIGYPVLLRENTDPSQRAPALVRSPGELESQWRSGARFVVEEAQWAASPLVRLWVAGERVHAAARLDRSGTRPLWRSIRVPTALDATAISACRLLQIDMGIVELVPEEDGATILRVLARGTWMKRLPRARAESAFAELARTLRQRMSDTSGTTTTAARIQTRKLNVLMVRSYQGPGAGYRTGNIQAVYHELLRQGHRIACLEGRLDECLVEEADLILQDPLHAFGFRPRGDALDAELFERAAERSHLLRRLRSGTIDKRAMAELAMRLDVRAPRMFDAHRVTRNDFPVVVKPRQGSLGIGVVLVRTPDEFARAVKSSCIVQEFIDSGAHCAVSIRAVTVVDNVVAAAIFFNRQSVCSNLSQGGRAIALTGPGQKVRPNREEAQVLEALRIDPGRRDVPDQVREMAGRIGRFHARHGAQMIGQDFVMDAQGRWYFLEVNMAFGTAVFNVTNGEGYPSSGRGMVHAGRLLAGELVRRFAR